MSDLVKYFALSITVTACGLIGGYFIGGFQTVFIVAVLAVLEISLSFDNAIVNATVLKDMDERWRQRFLTWGILIAVFGMRVIFPLLIVSVVSQTSPFEALAMAVNAPQTYAETVSSANVGLMAFGGCFLMMVGLEFFLQDEKSHWLPWIEKPMMQLGGLNYAAQLITIACLSLIALTGLSGQSQMSFLLAGSAGVITFTIIHSICDLMAQKERKRASQHLVKSGFSMFIYLEVLDASFSFDGVMGAFAISTNLAVIAIGLGIGAMFVRSFTIVLVEKETLTEYHYLEHGAFYAIIALALMMLLKSFYHIPEVITGLTGAGLIALSFIHSIILNRRLVS